MRPLYGWLILALAAPAAAHPAKVRHRAAHAAAAAPAAAPAASPAPAAPAGPQISTAAAGIGLAAVAQDDGLIAAQPLPGSLAEALGISAGDVLLSLQGRASQTSADLAAALAQWEPGQRLEATVRRGLESVSLEGAPPAVMPRLERQDGALSPRERAFKEERLAKAGDAAKAALLAAPRLDFAIHARQALWLRFPGGVPLSAAVGGVFAGETTTGVPSDSNLDFFSLPPRSRIWARVLSVDATGDVRTVRLELFRLRAAGGHDYRIEAFLTDLAGDRALARVTSGGTLVQGAPVAPRRKDQLISPDLILRAELRQPFTLMEGPAYYRAGPGLWVRTIDTVAGPRLSVSKVVAGRSAAQAGLRVGDLVESIDGRSTRGLGFTEAIDALYGTPGSSLKLSVTSADGSAPRSLTLERGAAYDAGKASALPLPFAR